MRKWDIPDIGPLFYPPLTEWSKLLYSSNLPFKDETESLRKWICKELHLDYVNKPWIVTGHQPSLFHPGIWARNLILEYFSSNFFSLYIILDHDRPERVYIPFPRRNGILRIVEEFFPVKKIKNPCERISPPINDDITFFFKRAKEHLKTLNYYPLLYKIDRSYEEAKESLKYSQNLAQFMKLWRNLHEGKCHYSEIFVSKISRSPVFRKFFLEIARRADEFLKIYNEALLRHRNTYKIKTSAQPFPDLKNYNGMTELPFWTIERDERKPLFISNNSLFVDEKNVKKIDFDDPETLSAFEIRPRAVTLSIFTRLFLSDLFVHGVGGAKYQEIVDELIERFYHLSPPPYAILTLSMGLSILSKSVNEKKLREFEELERRVRYHPEKFVSPLSKNYHLVKDKKFLIKKIGDESVDKKIVGQRIREIDEILLEELEYVLKYLDNERRILKGLYEDWRVLNYREYPFILFNLQEVKDVLFQKVGPIS